jgi:soluble lytic murein transglycosylase
MALDQSQNQNGRFRTAGILLVKLLLLLILSFAAAVIYLAIRSHDPVYVLRELKDWRDYHRYDALIVKVAREYDLDPRLIKAVVWRESRFQADMVGQHGERGLMQVSDIAVRDWAMAKGVRDMRPERILNPEMNLEIGTWYLSKAVQRWTCQDDAVPFALAEYNAGKSRVDRWIRTALNKKSGQRVTAETFQDSIDFPSTARYVRTILARYDFYKRRGPLLGEEPGSS